MPLSFQKLAGSHQAHIGVTKTDAGNPDTQTADTVLLMRSIVRQSLSSPIVVNATRQAIGQLSLCSAHRDERASAIYSWIKSKVRFVKDSDIVDFLFGGANRNPDGEDFLITPQALLSADNPSGDCDDFSTLGASMLILADIQPRFVTIAGDPDYPSIYSHVYLEFFGSDNLWIPFDASHGRNLGWEYPFATRRKVWSI